MALSVTIRKEMGNEIFVDEQSSDEENVSHAKKVPRIVSSGLSYPGTAFQPQPNRPIFVPLAAVDSFRVDLNKVSETSFRLDQSRRVPAKPGTNVSTNVSTIVELAPPHNDLVIDFSEPKCIPRPRTKEELILNARETHDPLEELDNELASSRPPNELLDVTRLVKANSFSAYDESDVDTLVQSDEVCDHVGDFLYYNNREDIDAFEQLFSFIAQRDFQLVMVEHGSPRASYFSMYVIRPRLPDTKTSLEDSLGNNRN